MIALLLAMQAVPTLGALPRQTPPSRGCAAYLWSRGDRRFVAVAAADTASLRVMLDGKAVDAARDTQVGVAGYGLAERATYRSGDTVLTLEMAVAPRGDLSDGAAVPEATLTVERAGSDTVVHPVAGLIGCAATQGLEIRPGSVR
jgi:hypothetical protein